MSQKHWNLLLSDQLSGKSVPEQYAAYAVAYLDSAERLCALLSRSFRKASYERGTVVLYLAMHAVELFLKGAVLRKAPNEKFGHDVQHIYNRYKALYPGKKYHFDLSFTRNYQGVSRSEALNAKKLFPPIDQLFRYPQDKSNKPWPGLYAFEANSFVAELRELGENFKRIHKELGC